MSVIPFSFDMLYRNVAVGHDVGTDSPRLAAVLLVGMGVVVGVGVGLVFMDSALFAGSAISFVVSHLSFAFDVELEDLLMYLRNWTRHPLGPIGRVSGSVIVVPSCFRDGCDCAGSIVVLPYVVGNNAGLGSAPYRSSVHPVHRNACDRSRAADAFGRPEGGTVVHLAIANLHDCSFVLH
jgi:hypothetical protein